jgi:hypothetical protein
VAIKEMQIKNHIEIPPYSCRNGYYQEQKQ